MAQKARRAKKPVTRGLIREMQRKLQRFGWSARDMANYLGYDRSYLKKIESGARPPTAEFIRRFRRLEREYEELKKT